MGLRGNGLPKTLGWTHFTTETHHQPLPQSMWDNPTVSWQSKLQKCVALSTTEAEYIAATEAAKEMLWMKIFVQELGLMQDEYVVFCDSQSAMDLSKNTSYHSRTKHIDVRYH